MTGNIKKWQIWLADVEFEDLPKSKKRPVLILSVISQNNSVSAFKMTSVDRGDSFPYHRVKYWKESGLKKETSVILDKRLIFGKHKLEKFIGVLDIADQFVISNKLLK